MILLVIDDRHRPARVVRHQPRARRLRLEMPGLRGNPRLASRLEQALHDREWGVETARADARSGRILVQYAPAAPILEALRDEDAASPARAAALPVDGTPWHALEVDEALRRLGSAREGLDRREARLRLRRGGPNQVTECAPRSRLAVLRSQLESFPSLLLLGSSAVATLTRDFLDAGAILGTVGLDAAIGYRIERQNEALLASWRRLEAGQARLLRDGRITHVPAADLVPGDVVLLRRGDTVPADARVLDAHRLRCDEAFLTGESEPSAKGPGAVRASTPLAERSSQLFAGAQVSEGRGRGLVTATGPHTEAARIQRLLEGSRAPETPFERRLREFGRGVSLAGAVAGAGAALGGVVTGRGLGPAVRGGVALAVAAIPEGLPLVSTTALVRSMQRMRREGMVVRRLVSAETLGGVTVVCADKTGTLTRNEMRLECLDLGTGAVAPDDLEVRPEKILSDPAGLALAAAVLNSDVDVQSGEDSVSIAGSATEKALVRAAYAAGLDRQQLRRRFPRVLLRERDHGTHYVLSLHEHSDGGRVAFVKGAPEQVLRLCARDLRGALEPGGRRQLLERNARLAGDGLRVLAVAFRDGLPDGAGPPDEGFTLIGLLGLRDPLRADAAEVVQAAGRAGIRTVILTGDQKRTARAVARQVGLAGETVEARELFDAPGQDPRELQRRLLRVAAVARVDPSGKAQLVRALREAGEVVAVAGDGLNDAPALRAADVGIAIGARATDVSREAADIALSQEELGAVIAAVAEGRIVQDNLRRAVRYLLATNFAESALALGAAWTGAPDPFTPLRLLWLNLISDSIPAIALATEPGRGDEVTRPPAPTDAPLVPPEARRQVLRDGLRIAGMGAVGLAFGGPAVSFQALSGAQIGYALACRAPHHRPDPRFLGLLGGTALLHLTAMAVPQVRGVLGLPRTLSLLETGAFAAGIVAPLVLTGAARDTRIVRRGCDVAAPEPEEDPT